MKKKLFMLFLGLLMAASGHAETEATDADLRKTIDDITFAIVDKDVDVLMKHTILKDSFQFDKKYKLQTWVNSYSGTQFAVSSIEVEKIKKVSDVEFKAMMKINLTTVDVIGGIAAAPRAEVWTFVKGKEQSNLGKWLLQIS